MASSSSLLSTNITSTVLVIKASSRSQSFFFQTICNHHHQSISKHQVGRSLPKNGNFPYLKTCRLKTSQPIDHKRSKRCRDFAVKCAPEPSGLLPFLPHDNSWINWLWGLLAVLPFLVQRLLTLTKEVETAAETVEKVVESVEKVAEDVEKMAEDFAEKLPDGGKLKQVVTFVENVAEETAKDAQLVDDFLDKVEELDQKVETMIRDGSKPTTNDQN